MILMCFWKIFLKRLISYFLHLRNGNTSCDWTPVSLFEVVYREALQIIHLLGTNNWWKLLQHSKGSCLILWHCSVALMQGFMNLSGHSEFLLSWNLTPLLSLYRETMRKAGTTWHEFWYSQRATKMMYFWQWLPLQPAGLPTSLPYS